MSVQFGVIGAFSIDHVVNAQGTVATRQCGGKRVHSSVGAMLWNKSIGVVARIGENFPREWVRQLKEAGADVSGVREIPGPHLMEGGMYYDQLGQRDRFSPKAFFGARGLPVPEGMPDTFASDDDEVYDQAQLSFAPEPADVPAEYLNAKLFHLASRYYGKHQRSLAFLRKHGIQVTLDPGIWYMRQEDEARVAALFKDVDYLLPSKEEVQALLGDVDLVQAAKRLASFGPRVVVIKVGKDGSIVYDRTSDRLERVPVYPAQVKDPTGAGDSFCGGFMVGIAETGDPVTAAMYGTVSASFIVEGFGACHALQFTREHALERLERLKKSIRA